MSPFHYLTSYIFYFTFRTLFNFYFKTERLPYFDFLLRCQSLLHDRSEYFAPEVSEATPPMDDFRGMAQQT
jgi:hypothetical protein